MIINLGAKAPIAKRLFWSDALVKRVVRVMSIVKFFLVSQNKCISVFAQTDS